MRQATWSA